MQNNLGTQTSPYLLQHAHNPVHWQPWGTEALELAKKLNKPILVSIGYSACHWCHVMEKESFENEATAKLMNDFFVNIKIDREERPDLDHIYMDAVQAMTGSGGWPLNVFLTPDAKPFYGGTYFPPTKAFNRPSWIDVLQSLHSAWVNKQDEMILQANTLTEHLKKNNNYGQVKRSLSKNLGITSFTKMECSNIANSLLANADTLHGGFGKAPKFPQTFIINCLLQSAHFFDNKQALAQAELSLLNMYKAGIYDQLAGGLCRYSTDEEWLAPHFEKMLYDNALYVIALSNAYLLTKKEAFKQAIEQTINFIFTEMKCPTGGYYAAIDADSEGEEGKFYVWQKKEIENIISAENFELFSQYYDVTEHGNWEHKNILRVLKPLHEVAEKLNIPLAKAKQVISNSCKLLLQHRNKTRVRPNTDDKILLGWNALFITALCKAYAALQHDEYKNEAINLGEQVENFFKTGTDSYAHTYKNGISQYPAFLDDYAYLTESYIHLQEITANEEYLLKAKKIQQLVEDNFVDEDSNFYFFTNKNQTDIILRKIELYDGATPSANAVVAKNMLYIASVFGDNAMMAKALSMIDSLKTIILKHPSSFAVWAAAAINITAGICEIAITGTTMMPLLNEMLLQYIPNKILQATDTPKNLPLLVGKIDFSRNYIYLCRDFNCNEPVFTVRDAVDFITVKNF